MNNIQINMTIFDLKSLLLPYLSQQKNNIVILISRNNRV